MSTGPSLQATAAGLLSGLVGFASSFAVVLAGLTAVGASPAEAASGLMALCFGMGLTGIFLSLRLRMPISVAWSTPGAALLAATGSTAGFGAAIGAFLLSGALIVVAGLWKPLGRAIGAIPPPLANAMLAGVLFSLCLAPVRAVAATPAAGLSIILVWVLVARFARLWAVPAAVLTTIVAIAATAPPAAGAAAWQWPMLILPQFDAGVLLGLGLPLFIVTMASQNLPGLAVLAANGYRPDPLPLLRGTGIASLLAAPFGAHAINLAAITAAMCAGPDAHPDSRRRWWAGVVGGLTYCAFGLLAGPAASLAAAAPPLLVQAVAGLALLGALGNSLHACLDGREAREAALICFLVAASGVSAFGIGGAFWGLVAGGLVLGLARFGR